MVSREHSFHRVDGELWLQAYALLKELQETKACLYTDTLAAISDKIERIERELDILLALLQEYRDKKTS